MAMPATTRHERPGGDHAAEKPDRCRGSLPLRFENGYRSGSGTETETETETGTG